MRNLLFRILSIASILAYAGCGGKSSRRNSSPALTYEMAMARYCNDFVKNLPKNYFANYIMVPEDHSDLTSRTIKVFYYGVIYDHQMPTVFFNGGPFESSHNSYIAISPILNSIGHPRGNSFIFIDQRGTGCSTALPDIHNVKDFPKAINYGSSAIVKDAELIRKNLIGNRQWKIFGQSFGSMIVHRYIIDAPQSIAQAHAHGFAIYENPEEENILNFLAENRVLAAYFKVYPDDEARMRIIREKMNEGICVSSTHQRNKICGLDFVETFLSKLGFTNQWVDLHEWLKLIVPSDKFNLSGAQKYVETIAPSNPLIGVSEKNAGGVLWAHELDYVLRDRKTRLSNSFPDLKVVSAY